MKRKVLIFLSFLLLLAGVVLLLYPILSNYLYERKQQELAAYYQELEKEVPDEQREQELEKCRAYNQRLLEANSGFADPFGDDETSGSLFDEYESLLNVNSGGVMGVLEIPCINVSLLIYHGVSDNVMQNGVGHLPQSSLPVGGIGTHAVLSSHSGLSKRKLFTDLDQLEEGDLFYIHVLQETLAYQVDKIQIVLPAATDVVKIDPEQDYVTLITCTPYGVNSHRLLVRGTRVPYDAEAKQSIERKSGSNWQKEYLKYILLGAAVAVVIIGSISILQYIRRKRKM